MKENLIAVITGKAKASTQAILALLIALPGLVQIPTVHLWISAHPKVAAGMGTFVMIGTLLHNPKVQQIFGIEVPPNSTVSVQQSTTVAVTDKKE